MIRSSPSSIPPATAAWRAVRFVLLPLAAVAMFVPFEPVMPGAGLDASWMFAMNQALAQGLSFGDDIVFTFGPYASVYTQLYHPATVRLMVVAGLFLAACCWIALATVVEQSRWRWVVVLCVLAIGFRSARDVVLFVLPLLVALAAWRVAGDDQPQPPVRRIPSLIHVAALFAPLGLLPLIKGSALLLSVVITLMCTAMLLARRRPMFAVVGVGSAGLTMLVFWMTAGQSPRLLPSYLSGVARLSSGYTEAMSMDGNVAEIAYYLAVSVMVLVSIAVSRAMTRPSKLFHTGIYVVFFFIVFKAGFVRHDVHAMAASASLLFIAVVLALTIDSAWLFPVAVVAVFTWATIDGQYSTSSNATLSKAITTFLPSLTRSAGWLNGNPRLQQAFDASLARIRKDVPFPQLPGTSDIYSFDQSYLFASGSAWSPRPVFQSYAAYDPVLAEMNKAHLTGPKAPDNVILRVIPINGRLPSLEDGPSWPVLVTQYAMSRLTGDFLVLTKRQSAAAFGTRLLRYQPAQIGERVTVPQVHNPVLATIQLRPTMRGRVASVLFKSDQLSISLEMADGTKKTYRLIPGMAAAGFVVSPLVDRTAEFGLLYVEPPASRSVAAMTIETQDGARHRHWKGTFGLTFTEFSRGVPDDGNAPRERGNGSNDDVPASAPATAESCAGAIDVVNGLSTARGPITISGALEVQGWLAASVETSQLPEASFLVLTGPDGRSRYATAQPAKRPDVAAHFHNPALASAGVRGRIEIGDLQGASTIALGMKWQGRTLVCRNLTTTVVIAPSRRAGTH